MSVLESLSDLRAEEALLDAVLLRPHYLPDVLEIVREVDFHQPWHADVFVSIVALHEAGQPVDYVTVHHELIRRGVHRTDHDVCKFYALRNELSKNAIAYALIVADLAKRRRALLALEAAAEAIVDGKPTDEALATLEELS